VGSYWTAGWALMLDPLRGCDCSFKVRTPFSPWYPGRNMFVYSNSANLRVSIRSLLLPSFSNAFLRGLHTTIFRTCGFGMSYRRVDKVPISKVTCSSPRSPVSLRCRSCVLKYRNTVILASC